MTPADFMQRVRLDPETGCWLWRGSLDKSVPSLTINRGRRSARRVAWEMTHGPISAGHVMRCPCDDQLCVCPWHCEPLSLKASMAVSRKRRELTYDEVWRARVLLARQSRGKLRGRVDEIRQRLLTEPQAAIAASIGCSVTAISNIATGKSWRQPTGPLALIAMQAGLL